MGDTNAIGSIKFLPGYKYYLFFIYLLSNKYMKNCIFGFVRISITSWHQPAISKEFREITFWQFCQTNIEFRETKARQFLTYHIHHFHEMFSSETCKSILRWFDEILIKSTGKTPQFGVLFMVLGNCLIKFTEKPRYLALNYCIFPSKRA